MHTSLILIDPITGAQVADYTRRARNADIGALSVAFEVRMSAVEAARYVDTTRVPLLFVNRLGVRRRYRLAVPTLVKTGVRFQTASLLTALDDIEYTALWSATDTSLWRPVIPEIAAISSRTPQFYNFDTNNRLYWSWKKDTVFGNATDIGAMTVAIPAGGSRGVTVLSFDWECRLPLNAHFRYASYNRDWTSGVSVVITTGNNAVQSGSICATLTARERLEFLCFNNQGSSLLNNFEDNWFYVKITNLRFATSTTNMVNTTVTSGAITANVVAQTVTLNDISNVYVGQRLTINSGVSPSESVVPTVINTVGKQITAIFTKSHAAAATVKAIVIYDDEIIKDMLAAMLAVNTASGLLSSTGFIQSLKKDLFSKSWVNTQPLVVLRELASPIDFIYGVSGAGALYYYLRGTYSRAWTVRAADVELGRPLGENFANSLRAAHQDANGDTVVTAYSTDLASVASNGLTRRRTVPVTTTSAVEAGVIRDATLADRKTRPAQSRISFTHLYDRAGIPYPIDQVMPGDTVTITNLPAALGVSSLRTFTVAESSIDATTGKPSVVPSDPLPTLDVLLAQLAAR